MACLQKFVNPKISQINTVRTGEVYEPLAKMRVVAAIADRQRGTKSEQQNSLPI
jgi:hypothetical protein